MSHRRGTLVNIGWLVAMTERDINTDVLEVEELLEMVVEKLNENFQKMESKTITNVKVEKKTEIAKSETISLQNEPTQKKSFFRFFSLRVKNKDKKGQVAIDIPLEKASSSSEAKVDEIQVVKIEEPVPTDIDKVTFWLN